MNKNAILKQPPINKEVTFKNTIDNDLEDFSSRIISLYVDVILIPSYRFAINHLKTKI